MLEVVLKKLHHREQDCIGIYFPKDVTVQNEVRKIKGVRFSATHICWYVPVRVGIEDEIVNQLRTVAKINTQPLIPETEAIAIPNEAEELNKLLRIIHQKLKLRGYSPNTIKTYVNQFKLFVEFYGIDALPELSEAQIRSYLMFLMEKRKLSKSTQNQAINSIKFFFEKVLGEERRVYHLERPMREQRLPTILSENEVLRIFEANTNLKHKLALMLIYSAGLRRSELLNLRVGDVDIDRNVILVRGGKGRKDRQTVLAESVVPYLIDYIQQYDPNLWLLEGKDGKQYSATSLQAILKQSLRAAGIKKSVHLHTLRHSFATHLLESGTSTRYIQELLGHESPQTTELYTQVTKFSLSKIKSPLDRLADRKALE